MNSKEMADHLIELAGLYAQFHRYKEQLVYLKGNREAYRCTVERLTIVRIKIVEKAELVMFRLSLDIEQEV